MRIWIKIIAKFCFVAAILLPIASCDGFCEGCFGDDGCFSDGNYDDGGIDITKILSVRVEPDIVVEGDTAKIVFMIEDSLDTNFSYGVQIEEGEGCQDWIGTSIQQYSREAYQTKKNYCVLDQNKLDWVVPEVSYDQLWEAEFIVLNDSLFDLGIIDTLDCGPSTFYAGVIQEYSAIILDDTVSVNQVKFK